MSAANHESLEASGAGVLERIRLAGSFLTIFPLLDSRRRSADEVAASFGWFPLIGFVLGAILCIEDQLLGAFFGRGIRSILVILTLTIITGALHLDGLADAADALGARDNRERALAIMRDSRIGTFGTIALVFILALKIAALAGATSNQRSVMLFLAPGISRWAMVAVTHRMSYLREAGAGTNLIDNPSHQSLRSASIIVLIGLMVPGGWVGVRAGLWGVIFVLILRRFYRRWLGGVTGDLIGAAGEIVETGVMLMLSS
jgi:adenosylcobinamide-GDP ribazoletransferase